MGGCQITASGSKPAGLGQRAPKSLRAMAGISETFTPEDGGSL